MPLSRRRLTTLSLTLSLLTFAWVGLNLFLGARPSDVDLTICPLRLMTGIPCASCGTTRALCALSQGQWFESLYLNPLGILVALMATLSPLWIIYDYLRGKQTYYKAYLRIVSNRVACIYISIAMATLLLSIGIWNISKIL